MSRRKKDLLPIIVGGGRLKNGIIAMRGKSMRGFDLCIVWLKREFQSGETFEMDDVEGFETVIHICDRKSLEIMTEQLNKMLGWCSDGNLVSDQSGKRMENS